MQTLLDPDNDPLIVNEGKDATLTTTLTESDGVTLVDPTLVSSLTLTLFDKATESIINSRSNQDIQNANDATISGNTLTIRLGSLDNIIVGNLADYRLEEHVARIEYTWNDGTADRDGGEDFVFSVRKLPVPV